MLERRLPNEEYILSFELIGTEARVSYAGLGIREFFMDINCEFLEESDSFLSPKLCSASSVVRIFDSG